MHEKKTDVVVLTGFLGAGKTTLLKRILSSGLDLSKTAVIVNEFGDVGIDGLLLKETGSEIVEMPGGCVCCSLKRNLALTIQRLQIEYAPKKILIEATGVADPASILEVFQDRQIRPFMEVRKVVAVLEPDCWEERENFGSFFMSQLTRADLILLNKVDEVMPERIPLMLKEVHEAVPGCRALPTIHCDIDPVILWAPALDGDAAAGKDPSGILPVGPAGIFGEDRQPRDPEGIHPHSSDAQKAGFQSFSYQSPDLMDEDCFRAFIDHLPWELFRVKGVVRFRDRSVLLNYVGGRAEWGPWEESGETRLAFVGLHADPEGALAELKKCRAVPEAG